jgi:hypothetical protein
MQSTFFSSIPRRAVLASLIAAACALGGAAHAEPGQKGARAAAERDLKQFVQQQMQPTSTGAMREMVLGVSKPGELADAKVAYGFPIYTVDPKELVSGRRGMQSLTRATGQYRFMITVGERPVGMATVEKVNGQYQTVAFGAAVLANDVDASMRAHGNADKSNLRFVRVFQARSDLLEVRDQRDGRTRYAPLHSARASLQMAKAGASTLVDESEVLGPLREAVQANIQEQR